MRNLLFLLFLLSSCAADSEISRDINIDTNKCKWKTKYYRKEGRDCCWVIGKYLYDNKWNTKVYEYCPCSMGVKYIVVDTTSILCK